MLRVPTNIQDTFCIVGTDPGTHRLGLGALYVDMQTLRLRSFEAYTLRAEWLMSDDDLLVANHGHEFGRINALSAEIVTYLRRFNPAFIACESAYFNPRRPGAYKPLLASINGIRGAVLQYNPWMKFTLIEPSVIKGAVGAKGGANKVSVLEGMLATKEFQVPAATPLTTLDDHAIDSLAIAYALLKHLRN